MALFDVYRHWDPLQVCAAEHSYPSEYYSWIENSELRNIVEKIVLRPEEDYQDHKKSIGRGRLSAIKHGSRYFRQN